MQHRLEMTTAEYEKITKDYGENPCVDCLQNNHCENCVKVSQYEEQFKTGSDDLNLEIASYQRNVYDKKRQIEKMQKNIDIQRKMVNDYIVRFQKKILINNNNRNEK